MNFIKKMDLNFGWTIGLDLKTAEEEVSPYIPRLILSSRIWNPPLSLTRKFLMKNPSAPAGRNSDR